MLLQVRVVHGKEPSHFLAMFGGRLVVFAGGKAGLGSQQQDGGPGDTYLLQVRGTAAYNTKAEQVCTFLPDPYSDVWGKSAQSQFNFNLKTCLYAICS